MYMYIIIYIMYMYVNLQRVEVGTSGVDGVSTVGVLLGCLQQVSSLQRERERGDTVMESKLQTTYQLLHPYFYCQN